nr:MAG TPA: hypothetical protein [Caudoviricetes sp.]
MIFKIEIYYINDIWASTYINKDYLTGWVIEYLLYDSINIKPLEL